MIKMFVVREIWTIKIKSQRHFVLVAFSANFENLSINFQIKLDIR
jgi:hypothetical protein